jgi:hypothetical protein
MTSKDDQQMIKLNLEAKCRGLLQVLSRHLPRGTEGNCEMIQSRRLDSWETLKYATSRMPLRLHTFWANFLRMKFEFLMIWHAC